ncbi:cytochrome P450 [Marinactinospora rubrisoli]|uniref:Cytochrome P450 n=1 Tax=Marinactinospora rubrisoli TaxID=2715399 RepID=A0ABW2KAX8_9ACTN
MTHRDRQDGRPDARCPVRPDAVPLYRDAAPPAGGARWADLRARFGPVAPVEISPGVPGWLLLGYHENLDVLRDTDRFTADPRHRARADHAAPSTPEPPGGPGTAALPADGAAHRRLRAPVVDALSRLGDPWLPRQIREITDRLVDSFAARGTADLITEYAAPLPALVLNRLFGLEDAYGRLLAGATATLSDPGADPETAARAARRLRGYVTGLVARRRARPGADLASWLLAHPAGLSDEEAAAELALFVTAGNEPTGHLIGNALRLLLADPDLAAGHRGGALTSAGLLDHVMWVDPPVPTLAGRFAVHDLRIGDADIRAGEALVLGFAPAHADPHVAGDSGAGFAGNRAHLMWGAGPHGCPARALAREIAAIAVETVADRLPDLALAVPAERLRWRGSYAVHGLMELPVRFPPTAAPEPEPAPRRRPVRRMAVNRAARARGARYHAPAAPEDPPAPAGEPAGGAGPAGPRRTGRPPRPASGARYHVPERRDGEAADPLTDLLADWRRSGER